MFSVNEVLERQYPGINRNRLLGKPVRPILKRLLREDDFRRFSERYPHLHGIDFVEQILEQFNFSYTISDRSRENIPVAGRAVIIANHPIGTLDGLALLKLIYQVRPDVRIVANELLTLVKPLRPCLFPVDNMNGRTAKQQIREILAALSREEAVIIFPAGEVSRLGPTGIRDGKWHKGFLSIASMSRAPILPVHIKGRNSTKFYTASVLCKPLSSAMLVGEMFWQQGRNIRFTVGEIIPYEAYRSLPLKQADKIKLFKKHIYRIGKGKSPLLRTETGIAHPERRQELKKELKKAELLGTTPDGKKIFLYSSAEVSPVLREIGYLREVTFRTVGEGSGMRRDMDRFDFIYQHLILWDEDDLEIVGAYRFADSAKVIAEHGMNGLYTNTLFRFDSEHDEFLRNGLELGRSFVQKRYWGKRSLDYLWYGIGAFLLKNPGYRYLFGPVSISNSMPIAAKELLVYFYRLYFGSEGEEPCSKNPFSFSSSVDQLKKEFTGTDYKSDLRRLKSLLSNMGSSIPTLYKQYTELCEPGGVRFLDFNVDPDFNNCIDGLVVVDTTMLKEKKRRRYMEMSILKP